VYFISQPENWKTLNRPIQGFRLTQKLFSGNSVQLQGKITTNRIVLVRSNICVKQLLTG